MEDRSVLTSGERRTVDVRRFHFLLYCLLHTSKASCAESSREALDLTMRHWLANALFMTILPQTFLTLVRCHFMALTLLSAWHRFYETVINSSWQVNTAFPREFLDYMEFSKFSSWKGYYLALPISFSKISSQIY